MTNLDDGLLRLDDVCERYFGVTVRVARRRAALGTLPVPAFRLGGKRRGPMFIRRDDLEALIDRNASRAKELTKLMASAGAV